MKYTPIGISPEQAQFLETRKFQINEIARIFRVPPHMVGDLEEVQLLQHRAAVAGVREIHAGALAGALGAVHPADAAFPRRKRRRYFAKFNVEGLLRGDYASRMTGYATARQNGWMSANDIRELENMDRIPAEEGGDLYLINGNMLPLGNAGAFADTRS